jgi:hypothetical protein
VLDAILDRTLSFSKLEDETTAKQLAQLVYDREEIHGRERDRIDASWRKINEAGIGVQIERVGAGRAARLYLRICIESATPTVAEPALPEDESATTTVAERTATKTVADSEESPTAAEPDLPQRRNGICHSGGTESATPGCGTPRNDLGMTEGKEQALLEKLIERNRNAPRDEWEQELRRARSRGLTGDALCAVLEAAIELGDRWPSDLRKRFDANTPKANGSARFDLLPQRLPERECCGSAANGEHGPHCPTRTLQAVGF